MKEKVLAFLLVALALPIVAQGSAFSSLIVFGDSLSDDGNVYNLTGGTYPPPPYDQRFTNGPVAVEYLATSWGIPLTDFAYGGATTGTANYLSASLPGMAQQLNAYTSSLGGGSADPDALYIVWGGPNDLFNAIALSQDPVAALAAAANNIDAITAALLSNGAQHVFVPGMPDLGLIPAFASNRAAGTALTNYYNGLLQTRFASTPVLYFDTAAFLRSVIADPAAFGFTNVTDPCFDSTTLFLCGATTAEQNLYFFWDGVHPTTAVHQLMANAFEQALAVPEPGTLVLFGLGLAGLGLSRRRRVA